MAWLLSATCERCSYSTGNLLERGLSLYRCPNCQAIRSIEFPRRRFDMPHCQDCAREYRPSDRLKIGDTDTTECPRCHENTLKWTMAGHVRLRMEPEPEPEIGEIVHGWIKNTGYMQRLDIVRSFHRGRILCDQPQFGDQTPVEAKVLSTGSRSIDVEILGPTIDPLNQKAEQSDEREPE